MLQNPFFPVYKLTVNFELRNEYDIVFKIEDMGQVSGSNITVVHSYVNKIIKGVCYN